jgi:hypothetical protein
MPADDERTPDVTRRDALKKLGVAAGIAWSAPVVMTFYNAAGAAAGSPSPTTSAETTTVPPPPECIGGQTCPNLVPCSTEAAECVCVTDAAGGGRCVPARPACQDVITCGPDNSCPPGSFCALGTCCNKPVCIPFSMLALCPPTDGFAPPPPPAPRLRSGGPTIGSR